MTVSQLVNELFGGIKMPTSDEFAGTLCGKPITFDEYHAYIKSNVAKGYMTNFPITVHGNIEFSEGDTRNKCEYCKCTLTGKPYCEQCGAPA